MKSSLFLKSSEGGGPTLFKSLNSEGSGPTLFTSLANLTYSNSQGKSKMCIIEIYLFKFYFESHLIYKCSIN